MTFTIYHFPDCRRVLPGHAEPCTLACFDFNTCLAAFLIAILLGPFEVYGGVDALSNALLADAGHVFSDAVVYGGIGWFIWNARGSLSHKAEERCRRRGYSFLIVACAVNIILALGRGSFGPEEVLAGVLLWYAWTGLLVNILMVSLFWRHSNRTRAAFLHTVGDTAMSVAVVGNAYLNKYSVLPFRSGMVDVTITIFGSFFLIGFALYEMSHDH